MPPAAEVHVWLVRLGTAPTPEKRHLVSHVALRFVLGELTETAPESLRFERRCGHCGNAGHGKPRLVGPADLDFSLSHSGELALIAVARGRRVGADVERVRPRTDVLAIARGSLAARERRAIESPGTDKARRDAFFRCWTRKEAYLKARGEGLGGGLDTFSVPVLDDDPCRPEVPTDPAETDRWLIRSLRAPEGYRAAVAAEGTWDFQRARRQSTTLCPPNPKLFERPTAPRPFLVRSPSGRAPSVT